MRMAASAAARLEPKRARHGTSLIATVGAILINVTRVVARIDL